MRALLSMYGSREDVEPRVGRWDAPVATGVMPTGGWR